MSGVEIAGLVLGALPLVIHTLESYSQGVKSVKRFIKYRRELESVHRRLGLEVEMFRNICEELLTGLVPADKITDMLDGPTGPAWSDPDIEQLLKKRLQRSHTGFLSTVKDLVAALEEFKTRLKVDEAGEVPTDDPSAFKKLYKRLKFGLSRSDYEDLMQRIKEDNNYLKRLTSQNIRLEPARTSAQAQKPPDFEVIRDCARSLFSAIRCGFDCRCEAPHSVNLMLEPRIDDRLRGKKSREQILLELDLKITFGYGYRNSISNSVPWLWKQAQFMFMNESGDPSLQNGSVSHLKASETGTVTVTSGKLDSGSKSQKATRFAVTSPTTVVKKPDKSSLATSIVSGFSTKIADLCSAIWPQQTLPAYMVQTPQMDTQLIGYLWDEATKRKHLIYPRTAPNLRSISLGQAMTEHVRGPLRMSDKKYLAVTLASSLLQLCGTPWWGRHWRLDDIVLIYGTEALKYDFKAAHISMPISASEKVESLKWNGPSNTAAACPNIRNEFTFGLGILLIELCLGKTIEQLRIPSDLNPDGTEHVTTDFRTATRLLDEVYQEAGGRYGDAVRRCIYCEFDQRKASLDEPSFRRAVYERVVYWLEEDLNQFHYLK